VEDRLTLNLEDFLPKRGKRIYVVFFANLKERKAKNHLLFFTKRRTTSETNICFSISSAFASVK
jgi:hypothetical protein